MKKTKYKCKACGAPVDGSERVAATMRDGKVRAYSICARHRKGIAFFLLKTGLASDAFTHPPTGAPVDKKLHIKNAKPSTKSTTRVSEPPPVQ